MSTEPLTMRNDETPNWVVNTTLLWDRRRLLARMAAYGLLGGLVAAFALPKRYESTARMMPPESGSANSAMLATILSRASGGLGGVASGLLGGRTTGVLFLDLLHSRTIADHIIDRFDLQYRYRKSYRVDAVAALDKHTALVEDKKSGVISIAVTDEDPTRARDMAQAYVDELNKLVVASNTSSARRERIFIEQRLVAVQQELDSAQRALSTYSSENSTLDIKEETHAMLDSASRLEGEKIVGESELKSLEEIYGPDNVRVRAARARVGALQGELDKMSGLGSQTPVMSPYPSLKKLPSLAVPYANLYRRVRIEETVFELLSQQFEMAKVEEAKDTPAVNMFDPPLVPEKHSFPARRWIVLGAGAFAFLLGCLMVLISASWRAMNPSDPRKLLAIHVVSSLRFTAERKSP